MSRSPSAERAARPAPSVHPTREGLTLLELIVTLGVLAVLSTVAVTSLDPLADQSRYEATQRTLESLRAATAGEASHRGGDGRRPATGYIADTGSLPAAVSDLLTRPAGMIPHAAQSFDSDRDGNDDVSLSSGWRGPYLLLGPGQTTLLDGWGRPPLVDPDGGDFDFTSLGSDNDSAAPEDGYRGDLKAAIPANQYTSDAAFRLFEVDAGSGLRVDPSPSAGEALGVLLYCVNAAGGTSGVVEEVMLPVSAVTFEAVRANLLQGAAAARGVLWADADADGQLDGGETVLLKSYVHHFTAAGGADVRIEMDLR